MARTACRRQLRNVTHQGAKNSACKNAARQISSLKTSESASIGGAPSTSGVPVISSGGSIIDQRTVPRYSSIAEGQVARRNSYAPQWRRSDMDGTMESIASDRDARCIKASRAWAGTSTWTMIEAVKLRRTESLRPWAIAREEFTTMPQDEISRFVSQIQGRTLRQRLRAGRAFHQRQGAGGQPRVTGWATRCTLEALVRFSDEELKHQELFRRINALVGETLPAGYRFDVHPDAVARVVLSKSTWAVLALTLDIELFTQLHYRHSIEPDANCPSCSRTSSSFTGRRRASTRSLTNSEWKRHDAELAAEARDRAVDEFIELVGAVDGILKAQAAADVAILPRRGRRWTRWRRGDRGRRSSRPTDGNTSTPGPRIRSSKA